jgi:hypothetical protein
MVCKTQGEIKAEAFDALKEFRWKQLAPEDVQQIEKKVNNLLQNWLEDDILLYHAGMPVGSVQISYSEVSGVAKNIKISLQTLGA